MGTKKKAAGIVGLILIFGLSMHLYFWSETSLYYGQSQVEPIKIYWKVNTEILWVNESMYMTIIPENSVPKYSVSNLKLIVDDVINSSTIRFQIECENFSRDNIDFFDHYDNTIVGNFSRVKEYENSNPPDILLTSDLITNGKLFSWIQVWNNMISLNELRVSCKPFLKQVAFNTWEGEYLFDKSWNTVDENNITFAIADVQKLSFEVRVPSNYKIQNPEDKNLSEISGGFLVNAPMESQETFHLVITDLNQERTRIILEWLSYLGFGSILLGLLLSLTFVYRRRK